MCELPFKTGESSMDRLADSGADRVEKLGRVDDYAYNPALEFPGDEVSSCLPQTQRCVTSPSPPPAPTTRTTVFRLIRLHSTILSRSKRVAVLDGNPEVSIGRDIAPTARVRLKEMAVSKFHASIYWDGMRHQWGIVDMGSMHGTFVRSAQAGLSTSSSVKYGTRLSETRKSSMPRILRHLDEITVGGTTFLVHEHTTGRPCPQCVTDGKMEIPLYHVQKEEYPGAFQSLKRKRSPDLNELHPKRALYQLKNSLLSRHVAKHSSSTSVYKDRSALRRELHPEHLLPSPPSTLHTDANSRPTFSTSQITFETRPPDPPTALPSSNIGHKLLIKQGWSPGTALGERPEDGLVEPIRISVNSSRAGLGAPISVPSTEHVSEDWRGQAKQRRWDYLRDK